MTPHDQLLFSIWRHGRDAGLTLEEIGEALDREAVSALRGLDAVVDAALNQIHESAVTPASAVRSPRLRVVGE